VAQGSSARVGGEEGRRGLLVTAQANGFRWSKHAFPHKHLDTSVQSPAQGQEQESVTWTHDETNLHDDSQEVASPPVRNTECRASRHQKT